MKQDLAAGLTGDGAADRKRLHDAMLGEFAVFLRTPPDLIDPAKSFDAYGLDSIDAIRATGELGDRFGIELAPEFLIQHRTFAAAVDAMFDLVARNAGSAVDQLAAPIFVIPGGGGRDGRMSRLAGRCRPELSSEIISLGRWQDWIDWELGLARLVERCCDQILARRCEGALRLAGYSQGGQVAFAVAAALIGRGHPVDHLILFDCPTEAVQPPVRMRDRARWLATGAKRIVRISARTLNRRFRMPAPAKLLADGPLESQLIFLAEAVRMFDTPAARRIIRWLFGRTIHLLAERDAITLDNIIQMQLLDMMWRKWTKARYPVLAPDTRVHLFRSDQEGSDDLGWSRHCRSFELVVVKGDHFSMFDDDHIEDLVARFVEILKVPRQPGAGDAPAEPAGDDPRRS